jgi:hypothetical protein
MHGPAEGGCGEPILSGNCRRCPCPKYNARVAQKVASNEPVRERQRAALDALDPENTVDLSRYEPDTAESDTIDLFD